MRRFQTSQTSSRIPFPSFVTQSLVFSLISLSGKELFTLKQRHLLAQTVAHGKCKEGRGSLLEGNRKRGKTEAGGGVGAHAEYRGVGAAARSPAIAARRESRWVALFSCRGVVPAFGPSSDTTPAKPVCVHPHNGHRATHLL